QIERVSERPHQKRLAKPRRPFKQDVAAAEEGHKQRIDKRRLPDEHAADLGTEVGHDLTEGLGLRFNLRRRVLLRVAHRVMARKYSRTYDRSSGGISPRISAASAWRCASPYRAGCSLDAAVADV